MKKKLFRKLKNYFKMKIYKYLYNKVSVYYKITWNKKYKI